MQTTRLWTRCSLASAAAFGLLCSSAVAEPRTVTLQVSRMVCTGCLQTVTKALRKVDGVTNADVSLEKKEAVVTFDDAKTSVDSLTKATANAGFPSRIKSN